LFAVGRVAFFATRQTMLIMVSFCRLANGASRPTQKRAFNYNSS
jgi:hypothetical protein